MNNFIYINYGGWVEGLPKISFEEWVNENIFFIYENDLRKLRKDISSRWYCSWREYIEDCKIITPLGDLVEVKNKKLFINNNELS